MAFEEEFGDDDNPLEISDEDAESITTVQAAIDYLQAQGPATSAATPELNSRPISRGGPNAACPFLCPKVQTDCRPSLVGLHFPHHSRIGDL